MLDVEDQIRARFEMLTPALNERSRRRFAATEAKLLGRGGVPVVVRATGLSRSTVQRGLRELEVPDSQSAQRVRRPGGGRKRATVVDPTLATDLELLVEPETRGDPESPLRWTCKSVRVLARELEKKGHTISPPVVAALLHELGYSLQANQKTREGASHPDRNAQFEFINRHAASQIRTGCPVISVDTKKKELVGDFKNAGREWRPEKSPEKVRVHDFMIKELGKAIPYGVYDIAKNSGWVAVGVDHDTAKFAVATIRKWWLKLGADRYPKARSLMIVADGGGSNGSKVKLWKWELQRLVDEIGIPVEVSHLPPGTSKWNKIEHRLFSFITQNWRGKPLLSHAAVVSLIAATRTEAGLKVHCYLDRRRYPAGTEISEEQMSRVRLRPASFHGDWNYRIVPGK